MSLKEKLSGLARVPFVTRIVDQIKRTSKKQIAIVFSSVALAVVSVTAFAAMPDIHSSASSVSVLSPGQFQYDVKDSRL